MIILKGIECITPEINTREESVFQTWIPPGFPDLSVTIHRRVRRGCKVSNEVIELF